MVIWHEQNPCLNAESFSQENKASRKLGGWFFISCNLECTSDAAAKLEGLQCLSWAKSPMNAKGQGRVCLVTVADCLTRAAGIEANSIWKEARFFYVSWWGWGGCLEFYNVCLYLYNQQNF